MERRLYRIKQNKIVAGVASGLAEYFDIDPVLVRLLFVLLTFQGGLGILAYIILWIVVPVRKVEMAFAGSTDTPAQSAVPFEPTKQVTTPPEVKAKRATIAGSILIVIGVVFLADNLIPAFHFDDLWPVIFIAVGGGLLWNALSQNNTKESIS